VAEGSKESYMIVRTDAEGKKDVFAGNFDTYEQAQKELDDCLAHPLHTKYKQKFEIKRKGGEQGMAEEASPMIKPPANRFDNKQEAFDYAKEHGGKVFKSTYIDPNTGIKNIIFVVKKEQDMAEGSESDAYGNTGEKHECGSCDGTGIDTHDDECPECGGKGWVRDKESLKKKGVAEGKADYNFDIEDLKRLEQIRDLSTLKAQALALISKPSAKPMKPEKVEWFKNALERMNSPLKVIKLMYDLLLSGEGKAVVGTKSSMNPNSYRQRFGEQGVAEDYNGEYDDEAGMAETNLITIARAAQGLLDTIDNQENLPEWVQEKIAKVEGMMVVAWDYLKSQEVQGIDPRITESICTEQEAHEIFDDFERVVAARGLNEDIYDNVTDEDIIRETAAWRRKEGKSKKGGLNAKGVASYRRENPGSKLQMAVTTKPSKLKKGSKAAKRRKSFCARMSGVKGPMKKPNGKPTRKALALRKWNC
jgi:hypothetical protein